MGDAMEITHEYSWGFHRIGCGGPVKKWEFNFRPLARAVGPII